MTATVLPPSPDKFNGRLSLATCKRVLQAEAHGLSEEDVYQIRDLLYALADIDFQLFTHDKQASDAPVLELTTNHHEAQSHPLHPRLHRRAS